jgi:hypothetical protein
MQGKNKTTKLYPQPRDRVWEDCWESQGLGVEQQLAKTAHHMPITPPSLRCPPSVNLAASVLTGSMRTPTGSVCPRRSAHVTLQGSPTLGVQSSTPTVKPGRPHLAPGAHGAI